VPRMSSPSATGATSGVRNSNSSAEGDQETSNSGVNPLSPFNYESPAFQNDSLGIDDESMLAMNAAFGGPAAGRDMNLIKLSMFKTL
jgi:hypothetical protein